MALRVGPSAALVSFAELGGAEEEVAAGSDAARFVGAPLVYLFIYLSCVPPSVRALHYLVGRGWGEGPGEKGELEPGSKRRVTCR